eukprot:14048546-Heterocapsa_arctica.AAC.1
MATRFRPRLGQRGLDRLLGREVVGLVLRVRTGPRALRILLLELNLRRVVDADVRSCRTLSSGCPRRRIGGSL